MAFRKNQRVIYMDRSTPRQAKVIAVTAHGREPPSYLVQFEKNGAMHTRETVDDKMMPINMAQNRVTDARFRAINKQISDIRAQIVAVTKDMNRLLRRT